MQQKSKYLLNLFILLLEKEIDFIDDSSQRITVVQFGEGGGDGGDLEECLTNTPEMCSRWKRWSTVQQSQQSVSKNCSP